MDGIGPEVSRIIVLKAGQDGWFDWKPVG